MQRKYYILIFHNRDATEHAPFQEVFNKLVLAAS